MGKFMEKVKEKIKQANVNYDLRQKRKLARTKEQLKRIKAQTANTKKLVDLEKARNELTELRRKNRVTFDVSQSSEKGIRMEDIFK